MGSIKWAHVSGCPPHTRYSQGLRRQARYYRQATLNGNNCDCRISFGGDDKWKKATCPRAANAHLHGQIFENCLMKNMKKNHEDLFPQETALPHWLKSGTFHVLFNEYNHLEGNSIDFHDDEGETYSFLDPICSFTFKSPGILLVKRKSGSKKSEKKREERSIHSSAVSESWRLCGHVWLLPAVLPACCSCQK